MFFFKLISELESHHANYAVVGGFALILHGAVRGTVDVDLAIQFNKHSFVEIEKILIGLGLESRLPVKAEQVFEFRAEYLKNRNLVAWNFYNPRKPIESVDILLNANYDDIQIVKVKAFGLAIRVASLTDLIRMKQTAGRPQDLEDVKALKQLLGERK
jgi:hypothetical protein